MPKTVKPLNQELSELSSNPVVRLSSSVVLDFELIDGNLYLCIYNLSDEPCQEVSITSGKRIHSAFQMTNVADLNIFKSISYLAPRKRIAIFLDEASLFFQQQEDLELPFVIDYKDAALQSFQYVLTHDLAIYKDLPFHSSATRV